MTERLRYYGVDPRGTCVDTLAPLKEGDTLILHFADGTTARARVGARVPTSDEHAIKQAVYVDTPEYEVIDINPAAKKESA